MFFDRCSMQRQISLQKFEVFAEGLDHPEGLAFDADGNLWAGGELGQIYKISRKGKVRTVATLGGFNLGLTFSARQDLFVCNFKMGALIQLDRSGKTIHSWERAERYRFRTPNFSVFDREGNLYFSDSGEFNKDDGFLFVLRPNGKIEQLLDRLSFPNGLSLSADERTLYVVQSTKNNVLAVTAGYGSNPKAAYLCCRVKSCARRRGARRRRQPLRDLLRVAQCVPGDAGSESFAVRLGPGRDDACQPDECSVRRLEF
jgi:sugar lactone lactonase YvrE